MRLLTGMVACLAVAACGGGSSGSGSQPSQVGPKPNPPINQADAPLYGWGEVNEQAQFAGRDGAGVLVFPDPADGVEKAWLLGGWNATDTTHFTKTNAPGCCTSNEVWKSADGVIWQLVKPNSSTGWEGRHMAGWAVFNGKMWIIGGDDNSGHYQTDVWNSSDGLHWTQVAASVPWAVWNLDQPGRVLHYVVAFNNKLWVMGGQAMPALLDPAPQPYPTTPILYADVWNSSDGANWNFVGALPHALGMICGAVVFDNQLWVIGGGTYGDDDQNTAGTVYNEVWSTTDGVNWTQHASGPWPARRYHAVTVYNNNIWVLGGLGPDGPNSDKNDVWYSPDGEHWGQVVNIPWDPRHALSVYVLNGSLFLTGGTPDAGDQHNDIWRMDPD